MNEYNLLILGGGVIGLSCAWHIQKEKPDWRIAVADRPSLAGQASWAAAGMLAPHCEFWGPSPLFDLSRVALDYYPDWTKSLSEEADLSIGYMQRGALMPALDDESLGRLKERREFLESEGVGLEWLEGDDVRARVPAASPQILAAIWLPDEAVVNSRKLHEALREACRRRGVYLLDGDAVRVERHGHDFTAERVEFRLEGERGTASSKISVACERLLVAAGAWSKELGGLLEMEIPVKPIKGQVARLDLPEDLVKPLIHAKGIYLAPRAERGVIVGASMEHAGFDVSVDREVIEGFREEAARYIPAAAEAQVVESWAGLRPRPIDGMPIISPEMEEGGNVWLTTGHFRNGILLSGVTGVIMSSLIAGAELPDDLAKAWKPEAYSLSRFSTAYRAEGSH